MMLIFSVIFITTGAYRDNEFVFLLGCFISILALIKEIK